MIVLPTPNFTGQEIRQACVPGITLVRRRNRITRDEIAILAEETAFRASLAAGTLRALQPASFTAAVQKDMKWLYEKRLLKRWGAEYRAKIMRQTAGKCTYCHIAIAKTIDHSIPKSVHPRLSIEPANLVPACRDCNLNRGVGSKRASLSPFMDGWVSEVIWLHARVPSTAEPEHVEFFVQPDIMINADRSAALSEMVSDSELNERYQLLAAARFALCAARIRRGRHTDPGAFAQEFFAEDAEDSARLLGHNRWETAASRAWAEVAPFVDWSSAGVPR